MFACVCVLLKDDDEFAAEEGEVAGSSARPLAASTGAGASSGAYGALAAGLDDDPNVNGEGESEDDGDEEDE